MSESKTVAKAEVEQHLGELTKPVTDVDIDVTETREWLASLDYVLKSKGPDRVHRESLPRSAQTRTVQPGRVQI